MDETVIVSLSHAHKHQPSKGQGRIADIADVMTKDKHAGKYESLEDSDANTGTGKGESWKAKNNHRFFNDYEPYIVHDWKEGYFSYDPLKGKYKKLKKSIVDSSVADAAKIASLKAFDEELLLEIKKVYAFMRSVAFGINEDLSILEEEMSPSMSAKYKQFNEAQRNRNFELSLRSLYVKIHHLEDFYDLNYYCIIKTAKKFNKLLMQLSGERGEAQSDKSHKKSAADDANNANNAGSAKEEGGEGGSGKDPSSPSFPFSTRQFLMKWHQTTLNAPFDVVAQSMNLRHFTSRKEALRLERLFASTPDHLWKETQSGSFFFVSFSDKLHIIDQVKNRCIGIYSPHFRKNYRELAEFELRYVKNKERTTKDSKFFLGMKFGLIACIVRACVCVCLLAILIAIVAFCSNVDHLVNRGH